MAVRVTLECGHASVLRVRTTPEGYTHDWEVFVRGVDNADIHQYIDKVVFILHETFPKPKRVIKDPPYIVKESGYAGFMIPIHVYLRNKDEPKKFQIQYDLHLQPSGPAINNVVRHSEIFSSPSEDFKRKLLKGGAVLVSSTEGASDKGESKAPLAMVGKPKLSGSDAKKHRPPEPRTSNAFADLFGPPIKTAKVSPDNKKVLVPDKGAVKPIPMSEKSERADKTVKTKQSPHKDGKREKSGEEKKVEKKDKEHLRERDKNKEKSKRPQSPAAKSSHSSPGVKRISSPVLPKKPPSPPLPPPPKRPLSPKPKEKDTKKASHDREKDREKDKDKSKTVLDGSKSEKKKDKKKHKEDRDKEKKDKHKERDRDRSKENNTKYNDKVEKVEMKQEKVEKLEKVEKQGDKQEKVEKEKSQENRVSKEVRKSPKPGKEIDKPKEEKSVKVEKVDKVEKPEKNRDGKGEKEKQKHKHKKRDKKDRADGSKEKEKREKKERGKATIEKQSNVGVAPPPTNPLSTLLAEMPERDSSDSAPSPDDDVPSETAKQSITKTESPPTPPPPVEPPRIVSPLPPSVKKEKTDKTKKEKSRGGRTEERESKKRKRRSGSKGEDEPSEKGAKRDKEQQIRSPSLPLEPVSSSQSPVAVDTELAQPPKTNEEEAEEASPRDDAGEMEQVAPDSTNNTLVEVDASDPPVFSEDYVSQLKELQQKIMTLQDNQELQRVVQVIAETGQYEITKKTFDFDLCALDRRTVQRLQEFFSAS